MPDQRNKTEFIIDNEKLEIVTSRIFDAPPQMVWAAITDPILIAQWWGPEKYILTVESFELKPGGAWRIIHRDDKGHEFGFHGVIKEVLPFKRIVQTFNYEGIPPGHELVQTMTLENAGDNGTKLTAIAKYQNIGDLEGMVQSGMESGQRESYERLAELVRPKKELTIVRTFDAPRELVWKAWTDPTLFAKWWGPAMFTTPKCELDVRPGGAIYIVMQGPDGSQHAMRGIFKEIKVLERLVYSSTVSFSENHGEPDIENLNTVTLEEENGKTKMSLHIQVVRSTPAAEVPLSGQEMGWRQSLEKLAECLK